MRGCTWRVVKFAGKSRMLDILVGSATSRGLTLAAEREGVMLDQLSPGCVAQIVYVERQGSTSSTRRVFQPCQERPCTSI